MSKRPKYNHVRQTLTPTPPPPKTWSTPTYQLERYTIRRNVKTVNVQLHGLRGLEKRTESISFPLLPTLPDAVLVRAAVHCSPNKWSVHFGMNHAQFQGNFAKPLEPGLLTVLMSTKRSQSTKAATPPPPLQHNQPTFADTSPYQQQFQPPIPQPGQFHQSPMHHLQPPMGTQNKSHSPWHWYMTRTRKMQISLAVAIIVTLICFSAIANAAVGTQNTQPPQTTTTPTQQAAVTSDTPTPFPTPTQSVLTPTPLPTQKPIPTPTPKPAIVPTHAPQPTQPPKPTQPACQAINGNPWCYNFVPGKYITYPPSGFCNYFACIPSFYGSDDPGDGYIVQCVDGSYSQSGGESGACSYHGGVSRPLYSH